MGALEPQADAKEMGLKCGISCSMAGWYTERHPKLDPVATMTDGVFVAGVCQGPKDIPASVAQGAAAAARVAGHDHQGHGDDRADRGLDRRGGLLRLPHLQQHVPVQRHRVRRGEERQPRDHAPCARAAARAWPPARPASSPAPTSTTSRFSPRSKASCGTRSRKRKRRRQPCRVVSSQSSVVSV